MEDEVRRLNGGSPPRSKRGVNKMSPKGGKAGIVSGYGAVTDLENKLIDLEKQNKELIKEIRLLKRIQDRQGNALEKMEEDGYNERQLQ